MAQWFENVVIIGSTEDKGFESKIKKRIATKAACRLCFFRGNKLYELQRTHQGGHDKNCSGIS